MRGRWNDDGGHGGLTTPPARRFVGSRVTVA